MAAILETKQQASSALSATAVNFLTTVKGSVSGSQSGLFESLLGETENAFSKAKQETLTAQAAVIERNPEKARAETPLASREEAAKSSSPSKRTASEAGARGEKTDADLQRGQEKEEGREEIESDDASCEAQETAAPEKKERKDAQVELAFFGEKTAEILGEEKAGAQEEAGEASVPDEAGLLLPFCVSAAQETEKTGEKRIEGQTGEKAAREDSLDDAAPSGLEAAGVLSLKAKAALADGKEERAASAKGDENAPILQTKETTSASLAKGAEKTEKESPVLWSTTLAGAAKDGEEPFVPANENKAKETPIFGNEKAQIAPSTETKTPSAQTQAAALAAAFGQTSEMPAATSGGSGSTATAVGDVGKTAGSYQWTSQLASTTAARSETARAARTVEQVAVQLHKMVKAGKDEMTIHLRPADLGKIEIKLSFGSDKSVQGTVVADKLSTLQALQKDADVLQRALQEAGLQADAGSLQFSLRGDGQQNASAWEHARNESLDGENQLASSSVELADAAADAELYYITPERVNLRV